MLRRALVALVLVAAACGDNLAPASHDATVGGPVDAAVDVPVDAPPSNAPPAVIILIGDGMGSGALAASSLFRYGDVGKLAMEQLPYHGEMRTGGPSGITDSAAAATVIATGAFTYNGELGLDRHGAWVETILPCISVKLSPRGNRNRPGWPASNQCWTGFSTRCQAT